MYHIYNKAGEEVGTAKSYAEAYRIAKEKGGGKIDIRFKSS
jgi:hypothetical protein